jgi:hypothetical protein
LEAEIPVFFVAVGAEELVLTTESIATCVIAPKVKTLISEEKGK